MLPDDEPEAQRTHDQQRSSDSPKATVSLRAEAVLNDRNLDVRRFASRTANYLPSRSHCFPPYSGRSTACVL